MKPIEKLKDAKAAISKVADQLTVLEHENSMLKIIVQRFINEHGNALPGVPLTDKECDKIISSMLLLEAEKDNLIVKLVKPII